jgi:hypothetical protein
MCCGLGQNRYSRAAAAVLPSQGKHSVQLHAAGSKEKEEKGMWAKFKEMGRKTFVKEK